MKSKGFDISDVELGGSMKGFSGIVTVKTWSGAIVSCMKFSNGKIVKRIKKNEKTVSSKLNVAAGGGNCTTEMWCMYVRYCGFIQSGDTWISTGDCSPWENTGDCETFEVCEDDSGDQGGNNCQMYGVDCGGNGGGDAEESEPIITENITTVVEETGLNYSEEDISINGNFVPILFSHESSISRGETSKVIHSVYLHNTTADPMISYYTDKYNRAVTRVLNVFNHMNSYEILLPPTTVLCYWSCSITAVYKVNGSIYHTKFWNHSYQTVR